MIDRLVCANGGNPDPATTGGKDLGRAKAIEMRSGVNLNHLAGRAFQKETSKTARTPVKSFSFSRRGKLALPDDGLPELHPKRKNLPQSRRS